ncbi:family 31 glycoside hydrolase, partial [Ochromonadaceae sp. CCMP2298]
RWDSVAEASRTALGLRYQLLPHLYTLMYEAHSTGATVLNAMWVNYPSLPEAHAQEGQYMWSDSVLFTPVLEQGATAVEGFFPEGLWYSLFDQTVIDS